MINPPIGNLLEKISIEGSEAKTRYSLVIMTSKRARELANDESGEFLGNFDRAMHTAIDEINEGKIKAVKRLGSDEE
mgnify:CR=1 FL=1